MLFSAVLFSRQTAATAADPIFLRFEVSVGPGLHVLSLRVNVEHSGEAYSIAAEAETRSLADLFVDLRNRLQVRGRIEAGVLLPSAMRAETHRRGADFYTRIDYGPDGNVTAEALAATVASGHTRHRGANARHRRSADRISRMARVLARRGSCALALAVFVCRGAGLLDSPLIGAGARRPIKESCGSRE